MTGVGDRSATARPAPLVGIVIAAWNAEAFLATTLDSILAQPLNDWVCVVVDDGSTDATSALVARYAAADPRISLVRQANAGPAAARDRGMDTLPDATPYVLFADADDLLTPGALPALVAALDGHPEAVGAHGSADVIDEHGRPLPDDWYVEAIATRWTTPAWRRGPLAPEAPTTLESLLSGTHLFPPGRVLLRADVVRSVGGHDAHLPRGVEDSELLRRVARRGPLLPVDAIVVHYRRHRANLSGGSHMRSANALADRVTHHSPVADAAQRAVQRRTYRGQQIEDVLNRWRLASESLGTGHLATAARLLAAMPLVVGRWLRGTPPRPPAPWRSPSRVDPWCDGLRAAAHRPRQPRQPGRRT